VPESGGGCDRQTCGPSPSPLSSGGGARQTCGPPAIPPAPAIPPLPAPADPPLPLPALPPALVPAEPPELVPPELVPPAPVPPPPAAPPVALVPPLPPSSSPPHAGAAAAIPALARAAATNRARLDRMVRLASSLMPSPNDDCAPLRLRRKVRGFPLQLARKSSNATAGARRQVIDVPVSGAQAGTRGFRPEPRGAQAHEL
jgi:hypothetical protein